MAHAGPGPVRGAALDLADALRDALWVLQQSEAQLAADASTQAWQTAVADGR
ncbi:MAG: hypothetical protein JWM64_2013 [Frankiales bacterium]|nr:hypothetical protein [Frankiales bacterium]